MERTGAIGSEQHGRRPYVVIQNNVLNKSAIGTVIVCPITSNLRLGSAMGNVSLREGEASLPKASVVNVSQVLAMDRSRFVNRAGALSAVRVLEIVTGLNYLIEPREPAE